MTSILKSLSTRCLVKVIMRSGDTAYLPRDLVNRLEIRRVNEELVEQGNNRQGI